MSPGKEGRRIVILGALSGIAQAYARLRAGQGARFVLVARDAERLEALAENLASLGAAEAQCMAVDLVEAPHARASLEAMVARLGGAEEIVIAYGVLGDQTRLETNLDEATTLIATNFTSQARWLIAATRLLDGRTDARIVLFGSVAGDRGRRSNALYGATKAGLHTLAEGLAHRRHGPRIVTLKLGPIATPMTANVARVQKMLLSPEKAAIGIARAVDRGKAVAYVPGWWRLVMLAIRNLPRAVFNRMDV